MRPSDIDEQFLARYLLGTLSDEEQVRVEDRAFADPAYSDAVEAVEADLIDAYIHGELPPGERMAFEDRFLASPQRRTKVEFARALAQTAATPEFRDLDRVRPAPRIGFLDVFRGWMPARQFASAFAALLCIAGMVALVESNLATRSRLGALQERQHALETIQADLQRQLAAERERAQELASQRGQGSPKGVSLPSIVATLVLTPGLARSAGSAGQLVLGSPVQLAHFEVQLEERDDFPRFSVELRTISGDTVLTRGNLSRHRIGQTYSLTFDVPTSALPSGDYELTVKGRTRDSDQDIGYFYLHVTHAH
jgi:hypothetical protein